MTAALRDQLSRLAANTEAHGAAAVQNCDDAKAARMFRISEAADALFLALCADDAALADLAMSVEIGVEP